MMHFLRRLEVFRPTVISPPTAVATLDSRDHHELSPPKGEDGREDRCAHRCFPDCFAAEAAAGAVVEMDGAPAPAFLLLLEPYVAFVRGPRHYCAAFVFAVPFQLVRSRTGHNLTVDG